MLDAGCWIEASLRRNHEDAKTRRGHEGIALEGARRGLKGVRLRGGVFSTGACVKGQAGSPPPQSRRRAIVEQAPDTGGRGVWCHLLHCSAVCAPAKVSRRCRSMLRVAPENSSRVFLDRTVNAFVAASVATATATEAEADAVPEKTTPGAGRGSGSAGAAQRAAESAIRCGESRHEIGQVLDAFDGHGVVDRCAAAADRSMALQTAHPDRGRLGDELRLAFVKEKQLHLIKQIIVRFGVGNIEAKMIDQLILFLQPFLPTFGTCFLPNSLSQLRWKRRVAKRLHGAPSRAGGPA